MNQIIGWRALHSKVLCVAVKTVQGRDRTTQEIIYDWRAYIKDVPGVNHECEVDDVRAWGDVLPESIALEVFPSMKEANLPYGS